MAHRAVSYLILLDNVKLYDEMLYLFQAKDVAKDILRPLKTTITDSHLTRGIWRSAIHSIRNETSLRLSSSLYQVNPADVYFCLEGLQPRDKAEFIKFSQTENILLDVLPVSEFNALMSRLAKFCKSISYRKLRFIHNSDNAVLMEDIYSELQIKALKLVRHYEHLSKDGKHDILKIENYVKQGIQNYVTNLINFHTTKKRSRISNITTSCGVCSACISATGKCYTSIQEFKVTTLRLDPPKSSYTGNIVNTLVADVPMPDRQAEDNELYSLVTKNMDPKVVEFIDILFDRSPSEKFENWLKESQNIRIEDIYDDRKIANLALDYLNIDKASMRNILSKRYNKVIEKK
jgi:hypothetical protein